MGQLPRDAEPCRLAGERGGAHSSDLEDVLAALDEELDARYDDHDLTLSDHEEYRGKCESLIDSLEANAHLLGDELNGEQRDRVARMCSRLNETQMHHAEPEGWRPDTVRATPARVAAQDDVSIEELFADL